MPVYDIAARQQFASPVRSYYQGKALRADTALREKQAEALQQQIDADLPNRQMAIEEAAQERLGQKEQREQQQYEEVISVNAAKTGLDAYNATDGDEAAKRAAAREAVLTSLDQALDGGLEEVFEYQRSQGVNVDAWDFDPVEAQNKLAAYQGSEGTTMIERMINSLPVSPEKKMQLRAEYVDKMVSSGGSGRAPSLASLAVPIYEKILADPDYRLTEGEQMVLDDYRRLSPLERLLAQQEGAMMQEELGNENTDGGSGNNTESAQEVEKIEVLKALSQTIAEIPEDADKDETIERFLSVAKEVYRVDISKEEATIFLEMFPAEKSSFYPNAASGTINRPD